MYVGCAPGAHEIPVALVLQEDELAPDVVMHGEAVERLAGAAKAGARHVSVVVGQQLLVGAPGKGGGIQVGQHGQDELVRQQVHVAQSCDYL